MRLLAWQIGWWLPWPPRLKRWLMLRLKGVTEEREWPLPGGTESLYVVYCRSCQHAWWEGRPPGDGAGGRSSRCVCERGEWLTRPAAGDLPSRALVELGIAPGGD